MKTHLNNIYEDQLVSCRGYVYPVKRARSCYWKARILLFASAFFRSKYLVGFPVNDALGGLSGKRQIHLQATFSLERGTSKY
jgi:hypothetical protein